MAGHHILIVEDEHDMAEILRDYLKNDGYQASVLEIGKEVIPFERAHGPALILLDIMLPGRTVIRSQYGAGTNWPVISNLKSL